MGSIARRLREISRGHIVWYEGNRVTPMASDQLSIQATSFRLQKHLKFEHFGTSRMLASTPMVP